MTIPVEQLQKLDNITIIELFELQLFAPIHFATGDTSVTTLYRFHNGTNEINSDIIFNSNTYTAIACQAEGFESGDNTTMARPTITFANTVGNFSAILEIVNARTPFNDLQKAQVKRIRTMAQFLDASNFASNTNPYGTPDPYKKLSDDTYDINKKIIENNQVCSFELVNTIDSEDLTLPRNQITKDRFPAAGSFVFV